MSASSGAEKLNSHSLKIVKPHDAKTNCVSEVATEVERDHRELVKIEAKDDLLYITLVRELLKAGELMPSIGQSQSTIPSVSRPSPALTIFPQTCQLRSLTLATILGYCLQAQRSDPFYGSGYEMNFA